MKESVAVAKEAKKDFSPTKSDNSIHRDRNELERQLGSLRSVIDNIRRNGGIPSVESIATELSGEHTAQRASVLLALQRTHGNQYVQRVVAGIQAKLEVGQAEDIYEQEADRVADTVMRMPGPEMQRQPEEEEEILQTKVHTDQTPEIAPDLESRIHSLIGGGQPLPESMRSFFEPRFRFDFSQVRVHTNAQAAEAAEMVSAKAFTLGRDIVFGTEQYAPETSGGQRLLAHELTHVVQHSSAQPLRTEVTLGNRNKSWIHFNKTSEFHLARQCDPAWAGLAWDQRVTNANGMAAGAVRSQCFADLISEALGGTVTVHQSTNVFASTGAAAGGGAYTEIGTVGSPHINFDANLNAKIGPNRYGDTHTRVSPGGAIEIYIILGPRALNTIGPQFTRMAYEHESAHATKRMIEWAMGGAPPAVAPPDEELEIYTENFMHYFLDLWTIDNTPPCHYRLGDDFRSLFHYYPLAGAAAQNSAFGEIRVFYDVRVRRIPCNLMKFEIWLQTIQNARPAADPLVNKINGLLGLGLVKGTAPANHLQCPTPCP